MTFRQIAVLGGGAWGTALAANAVRAGNSVRIWAREEDVAESLTTGAGNPRYLPGVQIEAIPTSTDIATAVSGCDAVMSVVPAQFARSVFADLAPALRPNTPVALCSKGVEQGSNLFMVDILSACVPTAVPAVLSGPSFAIDVANGLPTAVTLACEDEAIARHWMEAIGRPSFRPYWTDDLIGAEVGGAVKNVLAIACGIVDGLELGKSAHAALISRGFAEMTRLGVALGAQSETMAGLCGLGDLVLTCSSPQSRNMSFGRALGRGEGMEAILSKREAVTEGVATAPGIVALAREKGVEMPICEAVAEILDGSYTVKEAITKLLDRPFRDEKIL